MKNKFFFGVLVGVWVMLLTVNLVAPSKEFSQSENRMLATFPTYTTESLLDGGFMHRVDNYINDHFIGRDRWIAAKSTMEYVVGKRENNNIYIGHKTLLEHVAEPNEEATQRNIAGIQHFAEVFGKPTYAMLVPSASEINPEKLPRYAPVWNQTQWLDQVYEQVGDEVTPVRVEPLFRENADQQLYFRTDHHWTGQGAMLAATQLRQAMDLPALSPQNYEYSLLSQEFYGTLYSKSGVRNMAPDQLESYVIGGVDSYVSGIDQHRTEYGGIFFPEYLGQKDKYSYFLGTNQPLSIIKTKSESQRKLLVFKDSYAHSLVPMLLDEYSEIALVDLRYLPVELAQVLDIAQYDEALFLYSVDVFAHQKDLGSLTML